MNNELRRFIYSIASIPHLEAMLLMQQGAFNNWSYDVIAQRLYLQNDLAVQILNDLCTAGVCKKSDNTNKEYYYSPISPDLHELIEALAVYYPRNLIEVTNMIHAKTTSGRRVQQFADAFRIHKDE